MEHVILLWLCRLPKKTARRDPVTGEWVLAFAWPWLTFPLLITGVFLVIAAHPDVMNRPPGVNQARKPRRIPTGVVVGGSMAFALLGLAGAAEMIGTSIRLGERAVVAHSPWRLPTTLEWDDLSEVTYSGRGDAISIRGADGTRIKVSFMMTGMGTLHDEFRSRLDPSDFSQTLPLFEAVGVRRLPEPESFKIITEDSQDT